MNRIFSLPIVLGIIAGILYPYQSLSLIWIASILLVFLLIINVLQTESAAGIAMPPRRDVGWLLFLLFGFFPVVQTAAAAYLLNDRHYVFGVALASLAPPALVIPMFIRRRGGDVRLGLFMVVAATVICPFILIPMTRFLGLGDIYFDSASASLYLLLLTLVPVVSGLTVVKFFPRTRASLLPHVPWLNSVLLGLLMFILVGSALNHVPLRSWSGTDLLWLTALLVWMDFGVYVVMRSLWNETAAIILATRNFAIPASLLLFFDPKAALAPAIGLAVHAVFFQWLMARRVGGRK